MATEVASKSIKGLLIDKIKVCAIDEPAIEKTIKQICPSSINSNSVFFVPLRKMGIKYVKIVGTKIVITLKSQKIIRCI